MLQGLGEELNSCIGLPEELDGVDDLGSLLDDLAADFVSVGKIKEKVFL